MSTAAFLQINFIPAIALLMMRHNTRQTLSFSWRTRVLRTEMLLFVLLLLCRTAILCNLGKGGFGPRILLKGLGVWYAFGLLACAYLCFLYVLDVAQDGNGQRGIKCWILAIPALIGSAVLLSNPWTKAVYFINMVNYYKKGPAAYYTLWWHFFLPRLVRSVPEVRSAGENWGSLPPLFCSRLRAFW